MIKLEKVICLHIKNQIDAGANVIQIFDSWAGLLPKNELNYFCYEPTSNIVKFVKSQKIPVICFPWGLKDNYFDYCNEVKPDWISIDYEIDPMWVKKEIKDIVIQGGLDPKILLQDEDLIKKEVSKYLEIFRGQPYIFNHGHGVLPETNPEKIKFVVKLVRENK